MTGGRDEQPMATMNNCWRRRITQFTRQRYSKLRADRNGGHTTSFFFAGEKEWMCEGGKISNAREEEEGKIGSLVFTRKKNEK